MHFFKSPTIHIDCFAYRRDVVEHAPILPATDLFPDWWLALPKDSKTSFFPEPTMKTCVGMQDYYAKSIALPLWSDLCINITPEASFAWQFSDRVSTASTHSPEEYVGFVDQSYYKHLKLDSPWLFKTKEDVSWIFTAPIYNMTNLTEYVVPQGIINFSKQHGTNIQMMLNVRTPKTIMVPFKTPFFFTPMSDKKVVIHRHLITEEQYSLLVQKSIPCTFINKYRTSQKAKVCPYKDETK